MDVSINYPKRVGSKLSWFAFPQEFFQWDSLFAGLQVQKTRIAPWSLQHKDSHSIQYCQYRRPNRNSYSNRPQHSRHYSCITSPDLNACSSLCIQDRGFSHTFHKSFGTHRYWPLEWTIHYGCLTNFESFSALLVLKMLFPFQTQITAWASCSKLTESM